MRKCLFLIFLGWCCCVSICSQRYVVSGKVVVAELQTPAEFSTATLLRLDSTLVAATMIDGVGLFRIEPKQPGKYLLKISFVGYQTQYRDLELSASHPRFDAGIFTLKHNDNLLGTATVKATAAKVEQVEDTTMFNASAYRVPEGSTLEALVKQLPGLEIADDGTITWNGKKVKEFLVNGKDFFKGQIDVAMQNLPADWISRIKAYEKQSDYAEQTGIDDGEEFPVLDIVTKKELNQTFLANTDIAYGTEDRYFGKLFLSRFTDRGRVSAYGSANNVSDKSFGGKRKRNGGGLIARKNAGTDFHWRNGKGKKEAGRLELGGNVNYSHSSTDLQSWGESENFRGSGAASSYRSTATVNEMSSTNVNAAFRLEWNPDTMTSFKFRPAFNHSDSRNGGQSLAATYNADPFAISGIVSPLDSLMSGHVPPELEAIAVNNNRRLTQGDRKNNAVNGSLTMVRRLNAVGRNISFGLSGNFSRSENNTFSVSNIHYYDLLRPGKYLNQYSQTPSDRWEYKVQVGYVEPIVKNLFLEGRYSYSNKYTESERSRYNLDRIDSVYGTWYDANAYPEIGTLPTDAAVLLGVRDSFNSQFATYRYFDHNANINLRYTTKQIRFTAGVNFNPEKTEMAYERPGQRLDTVITRKVFQVAPQLFFRYRFDKRNGIEARYRGWSSQPSMTDLLAVVDNSHPLNVRMGNPGLDPSWTNAFDIGFRGYQVERQQGIAAGFNITQTKDAVSQLSIYNEQTGIRYQRPENIDGNWNARVNFMFNTGCGKEKNFTIATHTNLLYNTAVGYISSVSSGLDHLLTDSLTSLQYDSYDAFFDRAEVQKNTTKTFGMRERLNLAYRKDWLEVGGFGMVNFNHSRSDKRANNDRDTWNYSYGINTNLKFSLGLSFSTDIRISSRRGYPNATMNTDEWLWNVQIAYSFLKKKAATISLQCYDILQQQSNVSHAISATHRSDSWNNDIHSYGMVHFIYKFRYIGGKSKKKKNKKKSWKKDSILDDEQVMPSYF